MSELDEVYAEGLEAAELDWVTEQSCPYPVFSREYAAWHRGFYDGSQGNDGRDVA